MPGLSVMMPMMAYRVRLLRTSSFCNRARSGSAHRVSSYLPGSVDAAAARPTRVTPTMPTISIQSGNPSGGSVVAWLSTSTLTTADLTLSPPAVTEMST